MRLPNLHPSTELLLGAVIIVAAVALLTRVIIFIWQERVGVPEIYPSSWTDDQRQFLRSFRLSVGFSLVLLWLAVIIIEPSMPISWPIGYFQAISLSVLLLITNAWVLFLMPRDWRSRSGAARSFIMMMSVVIVWWVFALAGAVYVLAKSTEPWTPIVVSGPIVAMSSHFDFVPPKYFASAGPLY